MKRDWMLVPPFVWMGGCLIYVFSRYSELPAEIPIHYGLHGADRWADKSPFIVAGPGVLGLVVLAAIAYNAVRIEDQWYWGRVALMYALAGLIGYLVIKPGMA